MDSSNKNQWLRGIPSVSEMLGRPRIVQAIADTVPRFVMVQAIQDTLDHTRRIMRVAHEPPKDGWLDSLEEDVVTCAETFLRGRLQKVINATGVVLHTNMGRALLPRTALEAVAEAAGVYTNLELDLATGKRGQRYRHVEELLCRLTGAESALVVNNNAAAVLLALNTIGQGREAIVSRGQLVEIGGSFRVPEVMAQSGVHMVEVGTTNKTRSSDYENRICENTGLLVRVHTSNYRIVGFAEEVSLKELVALGSQYKIPVLDDLGSGCMVDLGQWQLPMEPTVLESVQAGADIITFSADKLMGGPQAGIILGKKEYVDPMKKSPLLRALRLDKMALAALEAVLYIYQGDTPIHETIPVLQMLTAEREEIEAKASRLASAIHQKWQGIGEAWVIDTSSQAGGGSLPETEIATRAVAMEIHGCSAGELEKYLRSWQPPILTRIYQDKVVIDPRTLLEGDEQVILTALDPVRMSGRLL